MGDPQPSSYVARYSSYTEKVQRLDGGGFGGLPLTGGLAVPKIKSVYARKRARNPPKKREPAA
jgi:hypothetical protein